MAGRRVVLLIAAFGVVAVSAFGVASALTLGFSFSFPRQGLLGSAHAGDGPVDARIESVVLRDQWGPTASRAETTLGNLGVSLVNVEVYLFQQGTLNPVSCDFNNPVTLHWARNGTSHVGLPVPGSPLGNGWLIPSGDATVETLNSEGNQTISMNEVVGVKVLRTQSGLSYPVWDFTDVPMASARVVGGTSTTYFTASVDEHDYRTNVWAQGYDARALVPGPWPPVDGVTDAFVSPVRALIQVVWPHDHEGALQPVSVAPVVNVGVDLAASLNSTNPGWVSLGFGFNHVVRLYRALNDGFLDPLPIQPHLTTERATIANTSYSWPRFEFDDIDVSAAQDPANTYYFAAQVDGVTTHRTIWAHGTNPTPPARRPDVPQSSGDGC